MKLFLSEFDTWSHIFLKIRIFCKTIITFSSSTHLMKKSTFLKKFKFLFIYFFFFFFAQNWHFCTKTDIDRNTCHFASKFARHYFITVLINSPIWPKNDAICMKCYFLLKENNATKNWHFSETQDTSLRKLNISIKN